MLTNDLIRALCSKLGHEDGAAPCVKKLVQENWLETVDDLRCVPRTRLEKWGVPLKLISEIEDYLADQDAALTVSGVRSFMNYSVRPAVAGWMSAGEVLLMGRGGDEDRQTDPEEWAAKKVQRWFRARRARRLWELSASSAAVEAWLDREDFRTATEEEVDERRERRARAKLRVFVRRWRERRGRRLAEGGGGGEEPREVSTATLLATGACPGLTLGADQKHLADLVDASTIPAQLLRLSHGKLKDCQVMHLVRRIAKEAHHTNVEVKPYAHRLVTLNWLEDIADLDLVEDRHWEAWAIPEKVVIEVKAAVRSYLEERFQSRVLKWFGWS